MIFIQRGRHGDIAVHDDNGDAGGNGHSDTELPMGQGGVPARAIEMLYWSEEPGLLEIIRAIACLPVATRAALQAFLSSAPDAGAILASRNEGNLVLYSLRTAGPNAAAEGEQTD